MKNALVLMTALPPTTGHVDLIHFAASMPATKAHVMVSSRSFEPMAGNVRAEALSLALPDFLDAEIRLHEDDDAPQNPQDSATETEFWEYWTRAIATTYPQVKEWDYVVASEPYGLPMAQALGATFLPYDIPRNMNPAKAERVRENVWGHWHEILSFARMDLSMVGVMFGQESVGKSTLTNLVAWQLGVQGYPEFARPYLEAVGNELTPAKMEDIHYGQAGLQKKAIVDALDPVVLWDTDLFSTIGYYRLLGWDVPHLLSMDAQFLRGSLYFLLPDDVPFEADPLRYGGDRRETDMEYWRALLEEFELPYVEVPRGSLESKATFIVRTLLDSHHSMVKGLRDFRRD